uniref:Uncharacterized protein n=1 Tax=Aquila chrysaetos chrysaetos TaxID=223781 RepID=A0A663E1E7_AQUCH
MAALISACNFVQQAQEDLSSPTTSVFASHMGRCKATASSLEEVSGGGRLQGCSPRGWGSCPHRGPAGSASQFRHHHIICHHEWRVVRVSLGVCKTLKSKDLVKACDGL